MQIAGQSQLNADQQETGLSQQIREQLEVLLPSGQEVRFGSSPDHPELVKAYLDSTDQAITGLNRHQQRQAHFICYSLLLESICDSCVPVHWRRLCMDHIYRPLLALGRLAKSQQERQQVRRCYRDLTVLSRYFLS